MRRFRSNVLSVLRKFEGLNLSEENCDEYVHTPLPQDGYIRLLELRPGNIEDPIACRLKHFTIEQARDSYEAISYVWGDPDDTIPIQCDGKRLTVTRNLFNALWTIRHLTQIKLLWADAICINQKDNVEKGHQVKRMGKVYENASRVLAWLGPDEDGIANDCFALIRETVQHLTKLVGSCSNFVRMKLEESFQISDNKARWGQVSKLLRLPWWKRAWVIQESALAKNCVLLFGDEHIDFADVVTLSVFFGAHGIAYRFTGIVPLGPTVDAFINIQCTYQNSQTWRRHNKILAQINARQTEFNLFINILRTARRFKVSDKRDHVYAFLASPAACNEDGELLVEPDYRKPVDRLYLDVAIALLQRPREAQRVLLYIDHHDLDAVNGRNFPSWAPRWDKGFSGYTIGFSAHWYHAGGRAPFVPLFLDEKRLCVHGYVFDHLHWTSQVILNRNFYLIPTQWDARFRNTRQPAVDQLIEGISKATGMSEEELVETFCRTIVLGNLDKERFKTFDMNHLKASFTAYIELARSAANSAQPLSNQGGDGWQFLQELMNLHKKKIIYTQSGRLGVGPLFCEPNDICCLLRGVATPLILRKNSTGYYNLVGAAYINGVMAGELLDQLDQTYTESEIILV